MELRKFPKGDQLINPIGLGLGAFTDQSEDEIESIVRKAIDNGINFFDMCGGTNSVYRPFGKAIKGKRDKVYLELHFGAVYNDLGEYGWSRDLEVIKNTFEWEMKMLDTDYVDFGFLHCIDDENDYNEVINNGILDYVISLKEQNIINHLGFSSHTPSICNKLLDLGIFDIFLFSLNPAYDYELGDDYGKGSIKERLNLLKRSVNEDVAISVMKPYFGGQLLSKEHSPFGEELSVVKCLQYAIDRPGVIAVCPGVSSMDELDEVLKYFSSTVEDKDYSVISSFKKTKLLNTCVYCRHCHPCPVGIDIALINKYYDLSLAGDKIAMNHYSKLQINASQCIECGHCDNRCPFEIKQSKRMKEINEYFQKK